MAGLLVLLTGADQAVAQPPKSCLDGAKLSNYAAGDFVNSVTIMNSIRSICSPGDRIIVYRQSHSSVIAAEIRDLSKTVIQFSDPVICVINEPGLPLR
jgi:hypothetical protein